MGLQSTIILPDVLRSVSSASVSASYIALGTPIGFEARIIKIVNNSTEDVTVSWDGINAHDYVPTGGFTLYDLCTNRSNDSPLTVVRKGTQFYVMGTAGTGNIYLVVLYAYSNPQTPPM